MMDFLDSYSYGYDQISVDPVRSMDYDDSEFSLAMNSTRDPITKYMHLESAEKKKYLCDAPSYSKEGMLRYNERQKIKENIENILRPIEPKFTQPGPKYTCESEDAYQRIRFGGNPTNCLNCQKNSGFYRDPNINWILFIIITILTSFCMIQYSNAQNLNKTILNMVPITAKSKDTQ